jgi:hypothetical protein
MQPVQHKVIHMRLFEHRNVVGILLQRIVEADLELTSCVLGVRDADRTRDSLLEFLGHSNARDWLVNFSLLYFGGARFGGTSLNRLLLLHQKRGVGRLRIKLEAGRLVFGLELCFL